jgi:hypothetical protein
LTAERPTARTPYESLYSFRFAPKYPNVVRCR